MGHSVDVPYVPRADRSRRVLVDVGTTLSPEDELDNLAAAEAAVNAKDAERADVISKLDVELRRKFAP